ncbi:MAG: hypothetical protein JWM65_2081 [Sphingomonas bacterium]|nr:hypothetical protein [Sphingomonas bacterium]
MRAVTGPSIAGQSSTYYRCAMIDALRMLTLRPSLAAAAFAAWLPLTIMLVATSADAQTSMYVPAPPKPSPRPAWNCRAQQSVGTTSIHASRQLDTAGASLTDGAGWTDIFTADEHAPLTISVDWHSHPSPMRFAEGMTTLYFRTAQPMASPLRVHLAGRRTIERDGHQSYDDPHHFVVYEPIGKVAEMAGDDGALKWTLRGTAPGKSGAPVMNEGVYPAGALRALKAGFAEVLAQFDVMQADFAKRCQRL